MRPLTLVRRNLTYYWRTHIAVVLGVATAVAVLSGALVVCDSVRASLRDLVLNRLGKTGTVISAAHFFRENLASELASGQRFSACPLVVFEGAMAMPFDPEGSPRGAFCSSMRRLWAIGRLP